MPAPDPEESFFYSSEYRHGLDDKRRLQIPAKWRPGRPDIQFTLVLWPHGAQQDAFLLVLPPPRWQALVEKLQTMPFADPQAAAIRRLVGRKSDTVVLDKQGRICLPESMARAAGIEKEAMLLGVVDRFEIWSPDRYEAAIKQDEQVALEAFHQML